MVWDFLQRYDDSWIWRCADGRNVTESSRNFAALEECIADAKRHGYTPQPAPSRRVSLETQTAPRRRKTGRSAPAS